MSSFSIAIITAVTAFVKGCRYGRNEMICENKLNSAEAIFVTTLAECADVCLPACLVKICHQQICCVILIQAFCFAIDAYINQSSRDIFAETSYLQKWLNDIIYEREQTLKTKMFTFI